MLKIQCPKCHKGERSVLLDVLSDRRYRLSCSDCGFTYVLAASLNQERDMRPEREPTMALRNFGLRKLN